jgi:hypothetical protein
MKRKITLLTLILFGLTLGFSFGQSYTEDFEDGVVSDWQQYRAGEEMIQAIDMASAPAVLAEGGSKVGYIQDTNGSYTGAAILLMGDTLDANYTVEADVYVYENPSPSGYTGIVAYGDSSKSYYVKLVADFDSSNRFRLYNNRLNTSTFVYTFHHALSTTGIDKSEGWHHMKVKVSTNAVDNTVSYQCWYDNVDLGTYVDDAAGHTTSGLAGVYAFQQDTDGIAGYFDNFVVEPNGSVAIDKPKNLPVVMTLEQNFPNPFNPSTTISFDINEEGQAALHVYNVKGELVTTLVNGHINSGSYQVSWDGTNVNGQALPSGSYLVVLSKGNEQLSRSMLMIK